MKGKWIVIYGKGKITRPLSRRDAFDLFKIFEDAEYLVRIKRSKR